MEAKARRRLPGRQRRPAPPRPPPPPRLQPPWGRQKGFRRLRQQAGPPVRLGPLRSLRPRKRAR
eukprot:10958490-Lingulodinium_polyedra.AAC.1